MARVTLDKRQRKKWELEGYISREMKKRHISQSMMAAELGLKQSAFSKRMDDANFSFSDLLVIFQVLETDEQTKSHLLTM